MTEALRTAGYVILLASLGGVVFGLLWLVANMVGL